MNSVLVRVLRGRAFCDHDQAKSPGAPHHCRLCGRVCCRGRVRVQAPAGHQRRGAGRAHRFEGGCREHGRPRQALQARTRRRQRGVRPPADLRRRLHQAPGCESHHRRARRRTGVHGDGEGRASRSERLGRGVERRRDARGQRRLHGEDRARDLQRQRGPRSRAGPRRVCPRPDVGLRRRHDLRQEPRHPLDSRSGRRPHGARSGRRHIGGGGVERGDICPAQEKRAVRTRPQKSARGSAHRSRRRRRLLDPR